jgi:hypothetical protein
LLTDGKLTIGGYGEVNYNQTLDSDIRYNGKLDIHRMVMLFGYNFNSRTQFVTELEFEHVSEVYVEQAFLQYKLNNFINFRAGLLLVPMGIVNEYHEPTTFNGVERPSIDKTINTTTWREIGFGFTENILPAKLKYQAYLMNGFNGFNGEAKLNGKDGFRKGRQKGAESYISSPNFTAKVEFYGIRGLNLGLSAYLGNTQSTLYNGIDKEDEAALARADSSVVGISMLGLDARYNLGGLKLRGQYYFTGISNSEQYNEFTSIDGVSNDLGSSMTGYYAEIGYDILRHFARSNSELIPFFRYEALNTHRSTESNVSQNDAYDKLILTSGFGWKITPGSVLKADVQLFKDAGGTQFSKIFNAGVGVMF